MFAIRQHWLLSSLLFSVPWMMPMPVHSADDDPASVTVELKPSDRILFFGST